MTPQDNVFEVIPAIDLRGGKCVRLHQGNYKQETVYSDDPVAMAKHWEDAGALRLHVVDLDGAREGEPKNLDVAGKIAQAISIPSDMGGGIRTAETARRILDAGFQRFSIGTKALDTDFAWAIFTEFGNAVIADIASRDGKVYVSGWQEASGVPAKELALRLASLGCERIIFTDISRDGAMTGPNISAACDLASALDIPVIASGGVSSYDDLVRLAKLRSCGIEGAIVGKALYDGRIDLAIAINAVSKELASSP